MFPISVAVEITVRADAGKEFFFANSITTNILLHKKPSCAIMYRTAFLYHEDDRIRKENGYEPQATAVELAQLGGEGLLRGTSCPP